MKPIAVLFAAATALAGVPPAAVAAAAATYSGFFAFGDSLSDAGNDYAGSSHLEPFSPPYSSGRFSNGPVWVQDMAVSLGFAQLKPSLLGGSDYAYGGAETGPTPVHTLSPLDLPAQLAQFALNTKGHAPANALYTLSIGGNDLFDILDKNPTAAVAAAQINTAAGNAALFLSGLAKLGARHFLVMNVPDLGKIPRVTKKGALASAAASAAAKQFNTLLAAKLAAVAQTYGAHVKMLGAYELVDQAVANPAAYGFTDVTTACWTGGYNQLSPGTVCSPALAVQNQHLFWDDTHPTRHAHAIIAQMGMLNLP